LALTARLETLLRAAQRTHWAELILILAAWIVYQPALDRVFVFDQLWYFAELRGSHSFWDGLQHYDYAATRRYWRGDDALFRPLLFAWLALGNALFSYHHVWWNLANLGLHALVSILLYRLLAAIRPSPFALLTALLFVVLEPQVELVVWNHLGGYLLACSFFLIALRRWVRLIDPGARASGRDLAVYAAAFTAACLCHEAMVPIALLAAILAGLQIWRADRPRIARLLPLFSPVLTFAVLYVFHVLRVQRLSYVQRPDTHALFDAANLLQAVPASAAAIGRWTMELAVPAALELLPWKLNRFGRAFGFDWSSPLDLFNAGLFAILLLLLAGSITLSRLRHNLPLLALLSGGILAYAGVICLGRPASEVIRTTYYRYFFDLMVLILVYSLVDFERVQARVAPAAAVAIGAFALLHAGGALEVTQTVGRVNQGPSRYLTRISRFVDRHRAEPDFSFAIVTHEPALDPEIRLPEGYPDDPTTPIRTRRMTEILFERYYSEERPKYLFDREPSSGESLANPPGAEPEQRSLPTRSR
jgi:hypothetical protein